MATVLKGIEIGVKMELGELPEGRRFLFDFGNPTVYRPLLPGFLDKQMADFLTKSVGKEHVAFIRQNDNIITIFNKNVNITALDFCPQWIKYQTIKDNIGKVALEGISRHLESVGNKNRQKELA